MLVADIIDHASGADDQSSGGALLMRYRCSGRGGNLYRSMHILKGNLLGYITLTMYEHGAHDPSKIKSLRTKVLVRRGSRWTLFKSESQDQEGLREVKFHYVGLLFSHDREINGPCENTQLATTLGLHSCISELRKQVSDSGVQRSKSCVYRAGLGEGSRWIMGKS